MTLEYKISLLNWRKNNQGIFEYQYQFDVAV